MKFVYYPASEVGGLPARATLINKIREENENVLVLDAGDLNTGKLESNFFQAKPDILGYNYIGYDAMVLGNHEFDNPITCLKHQMEIAQFPFLSANVKTQEGHYLAKPYLIKNFNGLKVAILGLTTKATEFIGNPEHIKNIIFEDEIEIARKLVPKLQQQADIIIALVHMGIFDSHQRGSKKLAREIDGIDLIVDGHIHTKLDRPILIKHRESEHQTIIVQAWQWGLVLGRVDLWIDNHKIIDFAFKTIPINLKTREDREGGAEVYHFLGEPIEEDIKLLALLQPYADEIELTFSNVIGRAGKMFYNKFSRERETALGDLVADSMLWYTRDQKVDFVIQNGGGIKTDIPKGPITRKLLYELLPFNNSVVVLTLRGSDVRSLFDYIGTVSSGRGAFPQVSNGLVFSINRTTRKCDHILVQGKPIDPGKLYKIATNSYLAEGGDGYKMFLGATDVFTTSMLQSEILGKYIQYLGGTITPELQQRITILPEAHTFPFREYSYSPQDPILPPLPAWIRQYALYLLIDPCEQPVFSLPPAPLPNR